MKIIEKTIPVYRIQITHEEAEDILVALQYAEDQLEDLMECPSVDFDDNKAIDDLLNRVRELDQALSIQCQHITAKEKELDV